MASHKEEEAKREAALPDASSDAPPAYSQESGDGPPPPPPPLAAAAVAGPSTAPPPQQQPPSQQAKGPVPTAEYPFNFPIDAPPLPAYSPATTPTARQKPIAVPQLNPVGGSSPFLPAYPPPLLRYGITSESWLSFLETISAFLTASVSDRALSHAADVGKQIGKGPRHLFKNVVNHSKSVGKGISDDAKQGKIVSAAFGVVGGAISIPLSATFGTIGTLLSLPGSALVAALKKPQNQRERAAVYIAVANKDWFHGRGLHGSLLDSKELSELVGVPVVEMLESSVKGKGKGKEAADEDNLDAQLAALGAHVADLEVKSPAVLEVGKETLWVVLTEWVEEGA